MGVYKWKYVLTKLSGNYLCIGIMNNNWALNKFSTMYSEAHCICTDKTSYNMEKSSGNLQFNEGDIIECELNLDIGYLILGEFIMTGPENKYVYKKTGL